VAFAISFGMLQRELTLLHTKGPLADLAYLRPDQVPRRYPFSKAFTYHLLNRSEIKSILLHKPGSIRGISGRRSLPLTNSVSAASSWARCAP
jgi:hypothetical protein